MATSTGTATTRAELSRLLAPVVEAAGLDLEDVEVARAGARTVVRVVLDRDGGLDLDGVAAAATAVGETLDADDDVIPGAYVLEVTSRGVDRPLTAPRHWRRAVGRLVAVERTEGGPLVGRVRSADETAAVLAVAPQPVKGRRPRPGAGQDQTVAYADVARAVVQIEFNHSGTEDETGTEEDA